MTWFDTDNLGAGRANAADAAEEWRAVAGYEDRYEVSSLGRVRSLPRTERDRRGIVRSVAGQILNPMHNADGYPQVSLRTNGKLKTVTVHRLVGTTFHGEMRSALHNELAHLDGDRKNARADNLKWVSKVENHSHKRLHGTHQAGDKAAHRILASTQVAEIRLRRGTAKELAARYGVSRHTIYDIWQGVRWTADPISQVIDHLFAIKTPDIEWLERAGPIAARLNEESKRD